jgi:hypothetical protein
MTIANNQYGNPVSGPMAESNAGSGEYTATIPILHPQYGPADVVISINCPNPAQNATIRFNVYIDPAGSVLDTNGNPVPGATVTLYRSDAEAGPFTAVPAGSSIMSPANRVNPDTSTSAGRFGWDVLSGYYKVRASKAGCAAPRDPSQAFVETPVERIPPAVDNLVLVLQCNQHATTTSVTCSPSIVVAARSTTCTATVRDTATSGQTKPTGIVDFTSGGPGGFSTGGSCTLTGASTNVTSCQVTYTPSATTSTPVRSDRVTATYDGDSTHTGSSGSTTAEVLSVTLLAHGSFVIGDHNAVMGSKVTFWGSKWPGLNSLSGGPVPASFKGFVSNTPNNPPQCGDNWRTAPGNSSGPPVTVPQYMVVTGAGKVTQSGPSISGNAPIVVVVKANPGYGPDPGHPGTGTVVGIVCGG